MPRTKENSTRIRQFGLRIAVGLAGVFLLSGILPAQQPNQRSFATAEEATKALFAAVHGNNEEAIAQVLGAEKDLISSGDQLDDQHDRELFVEKFRQMHRLVEEPNGTTMLYIGAENWPFPIPLVAKDGKWFFDAETGSMEILFRRIGENEANAIQMCHKSVAAGNMPEAAEPMHGYHFRHFENGKSDASSPTLVAYPAEYRSSGVMTFVVLTNGTVYQADLGPQTETIAKAMTTWKPDRKWHIAK